MSYDALDDFAGPGGWDLGAHLIGLRTLGIEWDGQACQTAEAAGFAREKADVSTHDGSAHRGIPLYIASPPCTLFSTAGKGTGRDAIGILASAIRRMFTGEDCRAEVREQVYADHTLTARVAENDARKPEKMWSADRVEQAARDDAFTACLVLEPARRILELDPERVAMEQVPSVLPLWQVYAHQMRVRGWSVWAGVLCAADYGVPQERYRAILMGSQVGGAVSPPVPTHAEHPEGGDLFGHGRAKWVAMAEALPDLLSVMPACGAGMCERHGDRSPHGGDEPAPTVISKSRSWTVDRRTNSKGPGGTMVPTALRSCGSPAPTITSKSGEQWVLRMGNQAKSAIRPLDKPAPTAPFGHRSNSVEWIKTRPATTIVASFGADTVSPPGYRTNVSRQNAEGGVKITVAEGGVLQSFPADFPWQGSRTKQFEQVGNAIPPLLAAHILAALTGRALEVAA